MSTRAIAPIVGTDHVTVARDLKVAAPVANATPAIAPQHVDTTTGEIVEPAAAAYRALGALEAVLSMVDGGDEYGLTLTPEQAVESVRAITADLAATLTH